MASLEERTVGQNVNTWVQTIGIIVAATWAAYTFIYKEVIVPRSAPINITLNLQLKRGGTSGGQTALIAIELKVSATNPSSRESYLLPSAWIVSGKKITSRPYPGDETFNKAADAQLRDHNGGYVERHSSAGSTGVVACGSLFKDEGLKPGETVVRTLVFHVARGEYDVLQAQASLPSVEVASGVALEWTLGEEALRPVVYWVTAGGDRKPMEKDKNGEYSDAHVGLQMATSMSELSLWE